MFLVEKIDFLDQKKISRIVLGGLYRPNGSKVDKNRGIFKFFSTQNSKIGVFVVYYAHTLPNTMIYPVIGHLDFSENIYFLV